MNCNQIRELLPDLAAGMHASTPEPTIEIEKHIASCAACAAHLRDLQKTMALLDEWQAPEPSPYFDTRFEARLREEMARPAAGWLSWLRRPAWAMSAAGVVLAGALVVGIGSKSYIFQTEAISTNPPSLGLPVEPGTAVGDLQALERNDDLYADFDMLDELQVQDDVTANP
ncbi:MAG: zf-HC2 domain-containing protein [Terriglobales bacterium]|jgi:predicted anti-sigma-YlaC factor YlaD